MNSTRFHRNLTQLDPATVAIPPEADIRLQSNIGRSGPISDIGLACAHTRSLQPWSPG